jgi:hypothetical protein
MEHNCHFALLDEYNWIKNWSSSTLRFNNCLHIFLLFTKKSFLRPATQAIFTLTRYITHAVALIISLSLPPLCKRLPNTLYYLETKYGRAQLQQWLWYCAVMLHRFISLTLIFQTFVSLSFLMILVQCVYDADTDIQFLFHLQSFQAKSSEDNYKTSRLCKGWLVFVGSLLDCVLHVNYI